MPITAGTQAEGGPTGLALEVIQPVTWEAGTCQTWESCTEAKDALIPPRHPTFSPSPQSPDLPPGAALWPPSPEGPEPGFGDPGGGPSETDLWVPSLLWPPSWVFWRGRGRLPHFLQKLNMQTHSRPRPSMQITQQPLRVM